MDEQVPKTCDVVVVGAGLAGLACAIGLSEAGLDVHVLEASDAVGGRARTDTVDGFRLDRGFQVLSTAYPEARRALDLEALDLRRFRRAALLYADGQRTRLADPRREPTAALRAAVAPIGGLRDKAALSAYAGAVSALPAGAVRSRPDTSAHEAWRRRGISDTTIDRVLRPFFGGVVLESAMSTSSRFVDLMLRMFVRGDSAVPAGGMQRMAEQLADRLPAGGVHLQTPVRRITRTTVETDDTAVTADAVVVATDADTADDLLGGLPRPGWKGVSTLYHAAPDSPMDEPVLVLDTEDTPVNNTVVVTAAAPSYAPQGRSLVATSLVHDAHGVHGGHDEPAVRERLATLYGTSTTDWDHIATYDVPRALPAMTAPHRMRKPVRHAGAYVCGDHRDTSSIQGALVSGRRAATAVLGDLARGPR